MNATGTKAGVVILGIFIVSVVLAGTVSASDSGNITFDGIPKTGAWTYADSNISIPLNVSNYSTGISAFSVIIDIKGASLNNPPVYTTTSGGYVDGTNPYYESDTWCFAYNETNFTMVDGGVNHTVYVLHHSGVSVYGGSFGNESFRIGTLYLPLENRSNLGYVTLRAYIKEGYDEVGNPITGDTGLITIGSRPYPQNITYYNIDTLRELSTITPLQDNATYGNVSAYVYAQNKAMNLYDATLGDTIQWSQVPLGLAKQVANFIPDNANPTEISGKKIGTAYISTVINFTAPTIRKPAILQFTHNESKFWKNVTLYDNKTHRLQTGALMNYSYVLEVPADFSLKMNLAVNKSVVVRNFTIPSGEQLNVRISSDQFDDVGNSYRLYYVKDAAVKVNYTIESDGSVLTNNQRILVANSSQKDEAVYSNLSFYLSEYPEEKGTYRDHLTFIVDFTN